MFDLEKIVMTSDIYVVTKVKTNTKAAMFKDLTVGSRLQFSMNISTDAGKYANYIKVKNLDTGDAAYKSGRELGNIIYYTFELEKEEIICLNL